MRVEADRRSCTVLIADDDPVFRGIIRQIVEAEPGAVVVGEAKDGEEAVRMIDSLRPQVVLMDVAMPRRSGLEALRTAKTILPDTKIIMVTVHGDDVYRRVALAGGADAFVLKKALSTELRPAIRRVIAH